MKDNVGYAKGNNAGARFLLKNFQDTDFLLFSNDDIILEDQNVLITLCETLTSYPDIGFAAHYNSNFFHFFSLKNIKGHTYSESECAQTVGV